MDYVSVSHFWIFTLFVYSQFVQVLLSFNIDITHPIIYKGPEDSYFGYSVALLKNNEGYWLLVGAPRGNDKYQAGINSPGALYKCPYDKTKTKNVCQQVNIDDSGNEELVLKLDKTIRFHHQKNNQWLGVSLDVKPGTMDSVVICAHRWRDSYMERNVGGISHMNGLCYNLASNLSGPGQLIPALTKLTRLVHAEGYAVFSMGTLGLSARFSEKGDMIVMGAPGLNDWSGGAVIDRHYSGGGIWDYVEPPRKNFGNSYIGYSVTTGKFIYRGTYSMALGAPRAENTGKVLVYRLGPSTDLPVSVIDGEKFGSYFGASLCVINYNDDHYDDLLIGAPMYAENGGIDQGRVYIFVSMGPMGFRKVDLVLRGSEANFTRFGSALVNLGDINLDGFKDIAVGAPYEDDGRGAIYIYNGYRYGIWPAFTQRILAKQLSEHLFGFGISFSRPYDMDQNGHNDIAVGSYTSGHAVLLRSRPVTDVIASLEVTPKYINPDIYCNIIGKKVPCIQLKVCFFYSGDEEAIPDTIDTNYTLRFDSERVKKAPRVVLPVMTDMGLQEVASVSGHKVLQRNNWDCSLLYTVYVRSITDKNENITFELTYEPVLDTSSCTLCGVLNSFNGGQVSVIKQYRVEEKSHFLRKCGADNVCHSKLFINGSLENAHTYDNQYIIHETDNLSLGITVYNDGEMAYETKLILVIPSNIDFREVAMLQNKDYIIPCIIYENGQNMNIPETEIECDIGDITKMKYSLVARLAVVKEFKVKSFKIQMKIVTSSTNLNTDNNKKEIVIAVKRLSEIEIYGAAIPDQLVLRSKLNITTSHNLLHSYELYNKGPNVLQKGYLNLSFPVIPGIITTSIDEIKSKGRVFECITSDTVDHMGSYDINEVINSIRQVTRKTIVIQCNGFLCNKTMCELFNVSPGDKITVTVQIHIHEIFTEILTSGMGRIVSRVEMYQQLKDVLLRLVGNDLPGASKERYIEYVSDANFQYEDNPSVIIPAKKTHFKVTTDIILPRNDKDDDSFHLWIILVSVFCGLLCFSTFGVLLWKCGFFKRKQRDDLQRLIEDRNSRSTNRQSDLSADNNDMDESHENLVMIPPRDDYGITENGIRHNEISTSHRATIFENSGQYLEPIQRLL